MSSSTVRRPIAGGVEKTIWVVPSTHIDLAWKKSSAEMAELLESFVVRLLDLMEQLPDLTYVIEQASHYRRLAKTRPDLIMSLKQKIAEGRIEVVGGMASTMETNMSSGESFIRNLELGLGWFHENLGAEVKTAWLIDTFGLNPQIPQILLQSGFQTLMANRFGGLIEHDLFWAQGLDGTRVLVLGSDAMNESLKPKHLYFKFLSTWAEIDGLFDAAAQSDTDGDILVMPYTENEGLPSRRIDLQLKDRSARPGAVRWQYGRLSELLPRLAISSGALPVISADLNPEFTATYSQRARIRQRNRQIETLLLETELWSTLAGTSKQAAIDELWWILAFNQFHDVFTGSHPTIVFNEVMKNYETIYHLAHAARQEALARVLPENSGSTTYSTVASCCVFNSLSFPRRDLVRVEYTGDRGKPERIVHDQVELPFAWDGKELVFLADLPPGSYSTFEIQGGSRATMAQRSPIPPADSAADLAIREGNIELAFDRESRELIVRLTGSTGTKEIVRTGLLVVQEDSGGFQIEDPVGPEISASAGTVAAYISDESPLGPSMVLTGSFPPFPWMDTATKALSWEAKLFLPRGLNRIDLSLQLSWKGERSRVRLILPVGISSKEAVFEVPFGTVRRGAYEAHGSARGEWPAQRFVVVEDGSEGIALINAGTSGHEWRNNTLWCSLLRAPASDYAGMYPDDTSSQHGDHRFDFCLVPYSGNWIGAKIHQRAAEFNAPLRALTYPSGGATVSELSFFKLESDEDRVVLSSIRRSRKGNDVRICLYETTGESSKARLYLRGMSNARQTDMTEESAVTILTNDGACELDFRPYEIKTLLVSYN